MDTGSDYETSGNTAAAAAARNQFHLITDINQCVISSPVVGIEGCC